MSSEEFVKNSIDRATAESPVSHDVLCVFHDNNGDIEECLVVTGGLMVTSEDIRSIRLASQLEIY